jgi:hypothetical protein
MKPTVHFLSEETLKARTVVSNNVDTKLLNQTIWDCQERLIQPILGTDLYARLQAGIDADNLTQNEKDLLDKYIANALMFYVMAELPIILGYKFYNKSVLKKTAENAESASMSEIADLMKYYTNKAEFYEEQTIKYLKKTASASIFPEYFNCSDIPQKDSGYSCSIVL